ncbi:pyruvate kinase [Porticoccus sp. W117]|uniref:pyruvate kinase n=1 Tax=Porticoccus sp. W117 TaxID=3054777 RepID=UPI0025964A74|nr:pyruvate kinase [Porticoccus sp. W117]MDM3872325.1 pyruvate kinase [Porticoccus sp. W117]
MHKRTKIIATLGPASSDADTIAKLIEAGANVFRINFSHGNAEEHIQRAKVVRQEAERLNAHVGLLGDLQGPKIRIASFRDGQAELVEGASFALDTQYPAEDGNQDIVGCSYQSLPQDCKAGQTLLLDDGRLQLEIERIEGTRIHTKVIVGGTLYPKKGINLLGGGLSAPALTEKDLNDLKIAATMGLDYLAISFPRTAEDMHYARDCAAKAGCKARLVAKIERAETVADDQTLDDMIVASDAVMVARGDLGVEIGDAGLIGVQKKIILRARQLNRAVITATQMMETMIDNAIPTRAEVFDVANAVLDGTDAVMLSAETATGKHPVTVVEAMSRIALGAEKQRSTQVSGHRMDREFRETEDAIAMASMYAANHMPNLKAIICFTESGNTPLLMSRIRSGITIFALSNRQTTLNRMALFRGVIPRYFDFDTGNRNTLLTNAVEELKAKGYLNSGDSVIGTRGNQVGKGGMTNTLKIFEV